MKSFGGVPFSELSKNAKRKRIKIAIMSEGKKYKKTKKPASTMKEKEFPTEKKATSGILNMKEQKRTKDELKGAIEHGIKVAIDCTMQDRMSQKEICMLAKQITLAYSANNRAAKPFHIYLTGFKEGSPLHSEFYRIAPNISEWLMEKTEAHYSAIFDHSSIVYLSPDAPTILEGIDEDHTYVVGGLVDEAVASGVTYNAASKLNLQSARFPIDKYMVSTHHQHCCLAINQVFSIMTEVNDGIMWPEVLMNNIPVRKGYKLKPEY